MREVQTFRRRSATGKHTEMSIFGMRVRTPSAPLVKHRSGRRASKRVPKRGNVFIAAMLSGAPAMRDMYRKLLASLGIYLKYEWLRSDTNLKTKVIPDEVEIFLVVNDNMFPRQERKRFVDRVRATGCFTLEATKPHEVRSILEAERFQAPALTFGETVESQSPNTAEVPSSESPEPEPKEHDSPVQEAMFKEPESEPRKGRGGRKAHKAPPLTPQEQEQLNAAGLLIFKTRNAKVPRLAAEDLGRLVHCSGSHIRNVEKGIHIPSDVLCENLEGVLELPEKVLPRLARRGNKRMLRVPDRPLPPARAAEPAPSPSPSPAPVPEPVPTPTAPPEGTPAPAPKFSPSVGRGLTDFMTLGEVTPRQELVLQLEHLREQMATLGVALIEIRRTGFRIEYAE